MKQILKDMVDELEWLSKNAGNWEYYSGKYDLCKDLLAQCSNDHDYYYDDADEFYSDPIEYYYNDLIWYKQQEIEDMFDKRNRDFIWWVGKDVINIDNLWFTSDEIEAFSVIWQRRISAV